MNKYHLSMKRFLKKMLTNTFYLSPAVIYLDMKLCHLHIGNIDKMDFFLIPKYNFVLLIPQGPENK